MATPGDNEPSAGPSPPRLPGALPPSGPDAAGTSFLEVPGTPPATRADGGRWFLYGLLGFCAGEVAAYLLVLVAAALAGQSDQLQRIAGLAEPPEWYVGMSLVGIWFGFWFGPWLASRVRGTGRLVADLGVRFRPVDLVGVVIGVGAQFAVDLAYAPFISNPSKFGAPTQKLTGAAHGGGFLVIALMTVVGAPFFEELFFRGLLLRAMTRMFTPVALGPSARRTAGVVGAVAADGLLFGLAHAEWAQFAGLAAFGMLLAVIAYRTGRLGMNMVSHASFNLVAVVAVAGSRGGLVH
jgi:membrane protease YdiL (CAAX protease family)